ncbi:sodium/proline symporter [Porifericola rhodea]|uniref:sodium/proline symporter n=1 Tax=Porifericola rhodea TaxID=930972 RepID=UPI002665407D|nr:sodium/proline symporter [Porifericola rhodea]WKN32058.1 sodium/proline symporter [Porifericola rhodea]
MLAHYLILLLYFTVLFGIGYLAARRVKGIQDYYVGGKQLGFWVVAFSSRATGSSAWVLLGLSGMGAVFGVHAYWVAIGTLSGEFISWFFMAKPFKKLTDKYRSITIPDYLESRFKPKSHLLRAMAATALSVFVMIYISAQIDATGTAFESFFEWNYFAGAILGFIIVVAYISFGGFVAVAWSDVFQGVIMLFGLVFLPIYFFLWYDNPLQVLHNIENTKPQLLSLWGEEGLGVISISRIIGFVMIGLGYLGSPQLFVRYMSVKSTKELDIGKWVALSLTLLMNFSAVTIGILGHYYLVDGGEVTEVLGNGGQSVLVLMVESLMPTIVSAIYVAAILAAIMSTIDSLLVLASSAITRDFYQKVFHPELKDYQLSSLSRQLTFGISLLALLLAMVVALLSPDRTIFWFVIFGWSGIAATFCPMMVLSLFWKSYNAKGAIASMFSGFLSVPLFKFVLPKLPVYGIYLQHMAELLPSFIISILFGIIASVFTKD